MKKLVSALSLAAIVTATMAPAQAAQVDVAVDVTLPSILVLYCYNRVSVSVDAANLATAIGASGVTGADNAVPITTAQSVTPTGTAGTLTGSLTAISSTFNVSAINLVLNNLCAVRAITASTTGAVTVSTAIQGTAKLMPATTGGGAGSISLGTPTTTGTLTGVTIGTPTNINVTMPLDLTAVQKAGNFTMGVTGAATSLRVTAVTP